MANEKLSDEGQAQGRQAAHQKAAMLARESGPTGAADAPSEEGKSSQQRPEHPDFWDQRFTQGIIPWDAGGSPRQLGLFAQAHTAPPPRTLIPGCGSAWEAGFLDRLGWPVLALDFSAAAVALARRQLSDFSGELVCADFFGFAPDAPFELIYERAFLCALPRKLWPAYARRVAELLPPGGRLAGYFFLNVDALRGPPFGISQTQLEALLGESFELQEVALADDSIGPFIGHEHWMVWRRR